MHLHLHAAGASEERCSNQNLCCYYICSFVYTGVQNNFHVYKNNSASSINATLWHYLGTYNLDFRHENNKVLNGIIDLFRVSSILVSGSNIIT